MSGKQQRKFIATWIKRLRLVDWDITFKEVEEFESSTQTGSTETRPTFHEAIIRIKAGLSEDEWERTIMHELLHVRFGGLAFDGSTASDLVFETGIELTTRALLETATCE